MRTLQEKYNGVVEGNFSKTQFLRDARMAQPQLITQYNSFEDAVQILKNKGMVTEAKVETPKYSTAKPEDLISPDVLDTGIKFELDKKFGTLDVSEEDYKKARAAAIKNLSKDVLYYISQDSTQLETPGEKMEKAKLKEGIIDKVVKGYKDHQINRMVKRSKKNALPAKTAKVLSDDEITAQIADYEKTNSVEDILLDALNGIIDLRNAKPATIQKLEDIAKKELATDHITGEKYMEYVNYLKNGSEGEPPVFGDLTKEESSKEVSESAKKFSQIIKTILEAEEDSEAFPEVEDAPASDYSHLANALKAAYEADGENTDNMTFEQTCADSLENGEVKVCFDALKGGNVIDEFTFLVSPDQGVKIETFSNTTDLGQIDDSVDSLSARIVNHWDSLQAPVEEGHGENPEKFKEADAFDPTKFYIKDLKSGRILNAVSVQGSKLILHYDTEADAQAQADWITRWEGDPGRFEVLPGTDPEVETLVNKQTGVEEGGSGMMREAEAENTLADIFKNKGTLDHLEKIERLRLKLINPEGDKETFLQKNPDWKNKAVKFKRYDAREKLVIIDLNGILGFARPEELVIDTETTNMSEDAKTQLKEAIKEGLDYETLEYMEGQVNIKAVDALITAARIIIRDLEDFDQEDVFEFLVDRLRTLEPIRESK